MILLGVLGAVFSYVLLPQLQQSAQNSGLASTMRRESDCAALLERELHNADNRRPDPPLTRNLSEACSAK